MSITNERKAYSRVIRADDVVVADTDWLEYSPAIDGVEFSDAWPDRVQTTFAGENVAVVSMNHLIVNKKAAGRLQDLADVEKLEAILASNTKER